VLLRTDCRRQDLPPQILHRERGWRCEAWLVVVEGTPHCRRARGRPRRRRGLGRAEGARWGIGLVGYPLPACVPNRVAQTSVPQKNPGTQRDDSIPECFAEKVEGDHLGFLRRNEST
jgi:hypothetical protein